MTPEPSRASLFGNVVIAFLLLCPTLFGQKSPALPSSYSANIVVPQQRAYAPDSVLLSPRICGIDAVVTINGLTAVTELTIKLEHPFTSSSNIAPDAWAKLTADVPFSLLIPIPERATLRATKMIDIAGMPAHHMNNDIPPRKQANAKFSVTEYASPQSFDAYHDVAAQIGNPTILEFLGNKQVRCGNFVLSLGQACDFTIVYEEQLTLRGNRVDYLLPRSESFAFRQTRWGIKVNIASSKTIACIYSPSHPIESERPSATQATVTAQAMVLEGIGPRRPYEGDEESEDEWNNRELEAGSFRLSWLIGNELSSSFIAYPNKEKEEGCFLMVAGAPPLEASSNDVRKRELILVIDRSGSMQGEKMEQVREAALKILAELNDGEAFNIVDYADSVRLYAERPVIKDAQTLREASRYVEKIVDYGGTNIHDALIAPLQQEPTEGYLPIVIFLTDGAPTIGVTAEASILRNVREANKYHRRIFSFGVGYDLNAPLLDAVARESKGTTTFALPNEDIEEKITTLFGQLKGPIFSNIELSVETIDGEEATDLVTDLLPEKVNDMFDGDRIILLGRYLGKKPLVFKLRGNYLGAERTFEVTFDPSTEGDSSAPWIRRLWANRRIMSNVAQISRAGAVPKNERGEKLEAEVSRMTSEIVTLSTANGIVTEYTDYLADPKTEVGNADELMMMTQAKLTSRAQENRIGKGAINQALNTNSVAIRNAQSNRANTYLDENLQEVEVTSVQQIHDLTFFRRTVYWVDSSSIDTSRKKKDAYIVESRPRLESADVVLTKARIDSLPPSYAEPVPRLEEWDERTDTLYRSAKRWVDARILDSAATQHPHRTIQFGTAEYESFVRELIRKGRQAVLALDGDILLRHNKQIVLITGNPGL